MQLGAIMNVSISGNSVFKDICRGATSRSRRVMAGNAATSVSLLNYYLYLFGRFNY